MSNYSVKVEKSGIAKPEVLISGVTFQRAWSFAGGVRRSLTAGETLFIESPAGFTTVDQIPAR
jgi:hypothetical protein